MSKTIIPALLIAGVLILLLWDPDSEPGLFVGRFHSLLVHFPIALLILAGVLEFVFPRRPGNPKRETVRLLLWFAFLGALAAAVSGYLLSYEGGFAETTLYWHLRLGLVVTLGAGLALLLEALSRSSRPAGKPPYLFRAILLGTVLILVVTGHLGGKLAHGPDYLTEHLPASLKRFFGMGHGDESNRLDLESATVYDDMVRPILERNCLECHGSSRNKGGLRLDTPEGIARGGRSGPVLVPGRPVESELVLRTILPLRDDERMPPVGNEPLDIGDIEILRWWIDRGASFDQRVREARDSDRDLPFAIQAYFSRHLQPEDKSKSGVFALEIPPSPQERIEALRGADFSVQPLAEGLPFLSAQLPPGSTLDSEKMAALKAVAEQLVWLDLSSVELADRVAPELQELIHLVRLNLAETNIDDEDLSALAGLPFLDYLNLYGTDIGDEGVRHLVTLKNLRSVYLWRTEVTAEGARTLQDALPGCSINLGDDLTPLEGPARPGLEAEVRKGALPRAAPR